MLWCFTKNFLIKRLEYNTNILDWVKAVKTFRKKKVSRKYKKNIKVGKNANL